MSGVSALYEPLIARDLDAIAPAVRTFRRSATVDELFLAVARFAVLSYAPSQHAKHAVLAALSAYELRDDLGERYEDVLVECAKYAASSRQPWSEPPITDPPAVDESTPSDVAELRAAIAERDRLRAERWLAGRLDDPALPNDLIAIAAEDPSDLGHKLIMADAALRLVPILGEKGKFVTLRMAVWEMTSYAGESQTPKRVDAAELLNELIERTTDVETAHGVFLFEVAERRGVFGARVSSPAQGQAERRAGEDTRPPKAIPVYTLARDLGATLKAHAIAKSLRERFPNAPIDEFLARVHHNLEHGPSLADWSFA